MSIGRTRRSSARSLAHSSSPSTRRMRTLVTFTRVASRPCAHRLAASSGVPARSIEKEVLFALHLGLVYLHAQAGRFAQGDDSVDRFDLVFQEELQYLVELDEVFDERGDGHRLGEGKV